MTLPFHPAAERLSSTIKGVLLRSVAEPAKIPLVEQARRIGLDVMQVVFLNGVLALGVQSSTLQAWLSFVSIRVHSWFQKPSDLCAASLRKEGTEVGEPMEWRRLD